MAKTALEDYLVTRTAAALRSALPAQARDAYAVYLLLSLDEAGGYRPSLLSLAWLTYTDVTTEKAKSLGSKWSGWAVSAEDALSFCDEERDPRAVRWLISYPVRNWPPYGA